MSSMLVLPLCVGVACQGHLKYVFLKSPDDLCFSRPPSPSGFVGLKVLEQS